MLGLHKQNTPSGYRNPKGAIMTRTSLAVPIAAVLALAPIASAQVARSAEIKVISANGLRAVLADVTPCVRARDRAQARDHHHRDRRDQAAHSRGREL
jgi:hypothetical protein